MAKKIETDEEKRITFHFDWLTENQKLAWKLMYSKRVTFLLGQAGTAKTFLATAFGAKSAVEWGHVEKVLLLRPTVEAAGEEIGFLPGTISQKVKPFLNPAYTIIEELSKDNAPLKSALGSVISTNAIAYVRGMTFKNSVVVVDEAQNLNARQMKLILSRLGPNSKIIFCGDTDQCDIRNSALQRAAEKLEHVPAVGVFRFGPEDNVRDPLINDMLAATSDL